MPSPEADFWTWFAARSDAFQAEVSASLEADLRRRLHRIHPQLSAEILPPREDSAEPHVLILTARGVLEGFAAVVRTALAAPTISGWEVTPFIPRSDEPVEVEVGNRVLTGDDFWFSGHRAGDKAHVQLYYDPALGLPDDHLYGIAFVLIDSAVGEYAAATRLGEINLHPAPADSEASGLRPLSAFRAWFDDRFSEEERTVPTPAGA